MNLPEEKRNTIIDAALKAFGSNGYRKASISDIANAAGISKAMVFHYFGTKKALYRYLIDYCGKLIVEEYKKKFDPSVTDFFDRIRLSSDIKVSVLKRHPSTIKFLTGIFFEEDPEVKGEYPSMVGKDAEYANKIFFDGLDTSKFKKGIDPKLVLKMLTWLAEGYLSELGSRAELDIDIMVREFNACMELLKSNLYE